MCGAPFVTGGANPPLACRGSGSLVTGFESGVEVPGSCKVCFGVWLPKGRIGGAPVTCETSSFSAIGEGEILPVSAPAAVLKLMRSLS